MNIGRLTLLAIILSHFAFPVALASRPLPIIFQPDWFSNAQFSGFFWAEQSGLYAEHGLEVSIAPFDFGVDFIGQVSSGEAAFGTAEAYILMDAVARGEELVALGAVFGESPAGYIYLPESGIRSAADLEGKRVGVHNYAGELLPFFADKAGIDANSVEAVEVQHKIGSLLDGTVDLHQGYAIDEMLRLESMTDRSVDILLFEEMGLPMYSMVIYSSRRFVRENPKVVEAFMAASTRGWENAMASPRIAALVVNGPYNDPRVEDVMVAEQAEAMKPFVVMKGRPTLGMRRAKWAAMQSAYLESGMISEPIDLDTFLYKPSLDEEVE